MYEFTLQLEETFVLLTGQCVSPTVDWTTSYIYFIILIIII